VQIQEIVDRGLAQDQALGRDLDGHQIVSTV
jgi:hypothetical protein